MTTSSVPLTYSTTSDSCDIGIVAQDLGTAIGNVTIGGTGSSSYYNTCASASASTITISNLGAVSGAISGSSNSFIWKMPEEFVDTMPDFDRIQKMCKQYPGLKIAFEKFKTTYYLVKDDYDTPENQRPLP